MRKILYSWATLTLLVGWASLAFAQPTAIIKIEGYSPQEILNMGWTSPRSTGLSNVGVNQLVYLVGRDSLNAAVTTYTWSLVSKPAGSNAVLDSINKKQTTFKPDVAGKFTVQLVITTAGGTSQARSVTINAAKFVGVGGMDGLPVDVAAGQCALCHNANFNQWTKTGHSDMLKRGLNGTLSDHYSEACIECHTTGYDADADGNDGFDDVQKELGWVFPTTLTAGNYDALKTNYPKLVHRANIQCESCHGPGSGHKGVDKAAIAMSLDEAVCGYCHEEGAYHTKSTQWKNSLHAVGVASASTNPSCTKCHSGWAFIRRIDPIPNDKRPESGFAQISCAVCHDQHRADLPYQVRSLSDVTLGDGTVVNYGGNGKLCMQCHISRQDAESYTDNPANLNTRFGPHHSNQADMLDGTNAVEYGIPIGSSGHKFAASDACVTCHMSATLAAGQRGNNEVGEHTWAMKWDGGTPNDPTDDVENVAVCKTCHGSSVKSFDDILAKADYDQDGTIEGTRHEIEGLIDKLDQLLPARNSNPVVTQNYDWRLTGLTPEQIAKRKAYAKAWFNLAFVEEDGSMGVHNAGYAIALLTRSIASITTGAVGAVAILPPIKDVPNDQGKQVRMTWSKAAGDGISTNPVTGYSVWRRVDDANVSAVKVSSKEAMFAQGPKENVGKRFTVAQEGSWDFVAWVPATGFEFYSVVAPTLYDSTAADGIRWSFFFVAAHAGSQIYESAPDSGYSVDNLAPFAPSNVVASLLPNKTVSLGWADPVDEDFQYFAIYRSTTAGFDPKGTTPLATLTDVNYNDTEVTPGSQYYYRISAYDFAGNESKYSPELNVLVTSVAERGGGTPTEYALAQNYPNPFNPETTIKYQLPGASHVRLSIYTALGQEVRRLVDYSQPAAYHQVVWDGRDNAGNPLPSGVYFYRLETEKFTAIKKMVMMK
ncbi:T9SS type A sorting domain-containing protein [candidate division KSB1 bacterium]|nr:T9SS type A sorting domain-containing protein [candidate division KSB1 bacterium]